MRMSWKAKLIMVGLSIVNLIISLLAFDTGLLVIKGFLFAEILLVASYFDVRTRIIPDWIHVLIILVGFIEFDPVKSIVGLILTPLPFLIMAMIKEGSIGGGDVKLIGAWGFVVGVEYVLHTLIISLIIFIIINCIYSSSERSLYNKHYPMIPYFAFSNLLTLVILIVI